VKRVVVLAEPETLFLPNFLAQLAVRHPLTAIVEVPSPPLKRTLPNVHETFGTGGVCSLVVSEVVARVLDRVAPRRFYSLRKVARALDIPYEKVSGLHAPDCFAALERHRPDVVLTQVSRRVRPELLQRATFWNKHCSLLPAYAGVYPVFWALLQKESKLGVTVHEMDEEFDRGRVLQQTSITADGHSFFSAYHELFDLAAPLVDRALRGEILAADASTQGKRSYYGFPTRAERAAFRRAGRSIGLPFRLHPAVALNGSSSD
jgi:methionyl-tRNA formyltransferase